jgi:hypothetical protein
VKIRSPNLEAPSKTEMRNNESQKSYDLEDQTFNFAKASRAFVKALPRTIANVEDVKQFARASGSANYIEANELEKRISS